VAEAARVLQRMRAAKPDMQMRRPPHACSRDVCNPQREADVCVGVAPESQNVYLCKFGIPHVCTEDACDIYQTAHTQTCHISGRNYRTALTSTYDKNDFRTWRMSGKDLVGQEQPTAAKRRKKKTKKTKAPVGPRRVVPKPLAAPVVLERARDLITLLLYSQFRRERNEACVAEMTRNAERARLRYVERRAQAGQLPYATDVYRIVADACSAKLPFDEYEHDPDLVNYYAHVVLQVWDLVHAHYPGDDRIEFNPVCLGTLYTMRAGHMCGGAYVLPRDEFLMQALPFINMLPFFKTVEKKDITRGAQLIAAAYAHALDAKRMRVEDLMLRLDKLPVKKTGG